MSVAYKKLNKMKWKVGLGEVPSCPRVQYNQGQELTPGSSGRRPFPLSLPS